MARIRRFQHGQLFKRGTRKKVWVARWWEDGLKGDGSAVRIRRSLVLGSVEELPTRRDAERLLTDRLRPVNAGEMAPQSRCTVAEFATGTWLPEVLPTLKYSTQRHYQYVVGVHVIPVLGDVRIGLLTQSQVQNFLAAKSRSGLSWKTVKHIRTVFGTLVEAAVRQGMATENPVRRTRMVRKVRPPKQFEIAPKQIAELLSALPQPSRQIATLLVLSGLRVGELLALRWKDVDLLVGCLRVRQAVYEGRFDDPKTRTSNRAVPLSQGAIEILEGLKRSSSVPEGLVFATRKGTPLSRRNLLRRQLQPTALTVGVTGVNWHWLRHATATLMDVTGAPLGTMQAILGHSSSEVTRNVYVHSIAEESRRALQRVEDLVIGPKWTQVPASPEGGQTLIQ